MGSTSHDDFVGRWKCVRNERFDGYLEAHGIGWFIRKLVNSSACTVEIIKHNDGSRTTNEITAYRTATVTFVVNVRYQTKHPVTLKNIWAVVTFIDGKEEGKCFANEESEDVTESTTRELLENGQMLQTIYFKDVVCRRWFEKE